MSTQQRVKELFGYRDGQLVSRVTKHKRVKGVAVGCVVVVGSVVISGVTVGALV